MKKKLRLGKIIYWIGALLWLFVSVFPLYFTVISSVKDDSEIFSHYFLPTMVPKFSNYAVANEMTGILRAIANSLFVSIGTVIIMLILVIPLAYVVARQKILFTNAVTLYVMAALMVPIQCAVVPIVQGVNAIHGQNNMIVLILIYAAINMPMSFFILTGAISDISSELDESAAMDGAGLIQIIFRIVAPVAKPSIATCAIVTFLAVYNELALANVLITEKAKRTISVALLLFKGDSGTLYSITFAAIILCIIPTVLFYIFAQEKVEKGLSAGALKG